MNKAAILNYLTQPIPRSQALLSTGLMGVGALCFYAATERQERQIKGLKRAEKILTESVEFLMERADGETIAALNQRLDFWRIALDMPLESMSNSPEKGEEQ